MIRKALMGFAVFTGLALTGLAATPAEAGRWDNRFEGFAVTVQGHGPYERGWGRPHPGWRGHGGWDRPHRGHGWGHAYGHRQRCFSRPVRYWDGWGWVVERRVVCR